jgi:hypothetical protein
VQLDRTDVPKSVAQFTQGYYCSEDAINDALKRKSVFNVIVHATSFKADFILLRDNEFQQLQFSRRTKSKIVGCRSLRYIWRRPDLGHTDLDTTIEKRTAKWRT